MKFMIRGADQDTGEDVELTIEAADEAAADAVAQRKGIMVAQISPLRAQSPGRPRETREELRPRQPAVVESGHYEGAPVINVAPPRRGNSLGVASLVLGILAFMICWIPLINLLGVPLSALGLLLGCVGLLIGLTRKGASIGYPIAGSAVCGLALFIALSLTGALVSGIEAASEEIVKDAEQRNATNQTVVSASAAPGNSSEAQPSAVDSPPAASEEAEWASAATPVRQGDVQVQVKTARVAKVPLKDTFGDEGQSQEPLLMIELELTNLSDTKKLDYVSWGEQRISFGVRGTSLTDNFENRYKAINFGFGTHVVGAVGSESIYPGKAVSDILVFENPIAKVEHLNLELPASQFEGDGMLRIRIPASMIQR